MTVAAIAATRTTTTTGSLTRRTTAARSRTWIRRRPAPVYGDACLFDRDTDGTIDAEDNCLRRANPDQADNERDGAGDVCDADDDNDALSTSLTTVR